MKEQIMSSINTTTSMRQRTSSILFIICAFMFMFLPSAGQVSYVRTYTPRTVMTPAEVRESNSCVSIVFYDGQLVELRTDGGWFSMWNDTLSTTQVRPYFYVTDYLGSVRLTVDGVTGGWKYCIY